MYLQIKNLSLTVNTSNRMLYDLFICMSYTVHVTHFEKKLIKYKLKKINFRYEYDGIALTHEKKSIHA